MSFGTGFLLATMACICCLIPRYDSVPGIEHQHQVLSTFYSRGQLLLEPLLPPLSLFVAGGADHLPSLAGVGVLARIVLCILVALRVFQVKTKIGWRRSATALVLSGVVAVWCWDSQTWTPMQVCQSISECLVALVFLLATNECSQGGISWLRSCGFLECLLAVAWMLGCNLGDVLVCYCVVYFGEILRVSSMSLNGHGLSSDIIVMACCSLTTARAFLQPVLIYLAILGTIFSGSFEMAAGGNYNLHFLSPQARRALSPAVEQSRIPRLGNHSIPRHSIVPYVPVSLYLAEAGFLWQDDQIWLPRLGIFGDISELSGTEAKNPPLRRVYFSDPIAQRHPWAFEQEHVIEHEMEQLDKQQRDYMHGHLWSGEFVSLQSRSTGRYLGLDGEQASLIDQELNVDISIDGFSRLRVSGHEKKSLNTTWTIEYDPNHDKGFRLFSPVQHCYLATSFRTYPDWDSERGNDTVSTQLNMIIEATCTRLASTRASTLYVIEGILDDEENHDSSRILWLLRKLRSHYLVQSLLWGYQIAIGLSAVQQSRQLYGELHDVPGFLVASSADPSNELTRVLESVVVATFCVIQTSYLLWTQRFDKRGHSQLEGRLNFHIVASSICVYGHCVCYYFCGLSRPSGGRLLLIWAVLGIDAVFKRLL